MVGLARYTTKVLWLGLLLWSSASALRIPRIHAMLLRVLGARV
jgi:hypothetical protein